MASMSPRTATPNYSARIAVSCLFAFVITLVAHHAFGAVAVVPTVEELSAKSPVVLIATVERADVVASPDVSIETVYRMRVDGVLKGAVDSDSVEVSEVGGRLGASWLEAEGTPRYEKGRQYLIFAQPIRGGRLRTIDMAAGAYRFSEDGQSLQRDLAGLVDARGGDVSEGPHSAADTLREITVAPGLAKPASMPRPEASGLDIRSAATTAAGAWTNESQSDIVLTISSALPSGNTVNAADGEDRIIEDDPNGVVAGTFNGSGIIAVAYVGGTGTHTFDSTTFDTITGADIVTNDGVTSVTFNQGDFATAIARELGKTLGFRNSDKNATGSANCTTPLPCSNAAVMSSILLPGVSAALANWDMDASHAMFGTAGSASNYAGKPLGTNYARRDGGRGDFLIAAAGAAFRKTVTWINNLGGSWSTPANWDLGVPATGDDVVINSASSFTVVLDTGASIRSLLIGANTGSQTLQIPWSSLTVDTGTLTVGANGALELGGGSVNGTGAIVVNGALNASGGSVQGYGLLQIAAAGTFASSGSGTVSLSRPTVNGGMISRSGSGSLNVTASFVNNGTIDIQSGIVNFSSSSFTCGGSLALASGSSAVFSSMAVTFASGSTISGSGLLELDSSTTNLDVATIDTLRLNGGTLTTQSPLAISGSFEWITGTLAGAGATTIATGATLDLNAYSTMTLQSHTLINQGTATWSGGGGIQMASGSILDNRGTLNLQNGGISSPDTSVGQVLNSGTIHSTAPNFYATAAVTNGGTVDVQSGVLYFSGGSFTNSGTVTLAAGSSVTFAGTTTLQNGSTLSGPGDVVFQSATATVSGSYLVTGTTTVSSGSVSFSVPTIAKLEVNANGSVTATTPLTITQTFTWSYGTLSGTGPTTIGAAATADFGGYSTMALQNHTLINNGTINWAGNGGLQMGSGSVLDNRGTLNLQNGGISSPDSSVGQFLNSGTIHSTAPNFYATAAVTNSGTIDVQSGTLYFSGGSFTNSGTMTLAAGTSVTFAGTTALQNGSTLSGSGDVTFQSATATVAGSYLVTGTTTVSGGSVSFSVPTIAKLEVSSNGSVTVTTPLTITQTFTWSYGTLSGTGPTTIGAAATADFGGYSTMALQNHTLINNGTINWAGNGGLQMGSGSVLDNRGTLNLQNGGISSPDSTIGQFLNSGTIHSTAPNFYATAAVTNSGTIDIQSGFLYFSGGSFTNSGTVTVAAGTSITFAGTTALQNGSTLSGPGDVVFQSATATVSGSYLVAGNTTVSSGSVSFSVPTIAKLEVSSNGSVTVTAPLTITQAFTWSSGTLSGAGPTTIGTGATADFGGYSTLALQNHTLINKGTINWTGSGGLQIDAGSVINNQATMNIAGGSISSSGANGQLLNSGTIHSTAPNFYVTADVTNSGVIDLQSGLVSVSGTFVNSGTATIAAGASMTFSGATALQTGSTLSGAGDASFIFGDGSIAGTYLLTGTTSISGGSITVNVPSIAKITISGGVVTVPSALSITQSLIWSGGTITGSGSTTVAPAATMQFGPAGYGTLLQSHTLTNQGTGTSQGNVGLQLVDGAVFDNKGTFTFANGGNISPAGATPGQMVNEGTIVFSGTGTFYISGGLANSGAITVQSGTLSLYTIQQTPSAMLRVDGTLTSYSGPFNLSGGILTGAGNIACTLVNAAEVRPGNGAGTLTVDNFEQSSAGQLTLDIGGLAPSLNDHLVVTGTATLNGKLQIVQAPGFSSFVGDQFPVMQYGSVSGQFSLVSGNTLPGQDSLVPNYQATQMVLKTASTPAPTIGTIDPTYGSTFGGDAFTLTGTNFQEGATVTFRGALATSVVVLNSSTLSGVTPPGAAGVADLVVTNADGQSVTGLGAFTYIAPDPPPNITSVVPATGPTTGGTLVTVNGTDFLQGATLTIDGRVPDAVTFVDATKITAATLPRAAGAVDVTVTNPAGQVTHPKGRTSTLASGFTYACVAVTSPSLVTPAAGATNVSRSVTLVWNVNPGDFRYDILLDTAATPTRVVASNVAANLSAGTNAFVISNLLPATTYSWQIVAKGDPGCTPVTQSSSAIRSFTTEGSCTVPGAFSATSPTDGAVGQTSSIQLSWGTAAGASLYDVYLGPSNPPAYFGSTFSTTLGANNLVAGTTYYWSVVARASCDQSRTTAIPVHSFTIQGGCVAPGTFTIVAPSDGATAVATTPTLSWTSSTNASAYDLYLGTTATPPLLLTDYTKQSISIAGLTAGATYYWKIVAKAGCDATKTVASPVVSFTTGTSCSAPGAVSFTFLPPGSVGRGQTYAVAWSTSAGLGSGGTYVVDRSTDSTFGTILDSQTTAATSATFIADTEGTYYHRVRAVQGCDPGQVSAYSPAATVAVVKGRPSVIFTVQPQAILTTLGEDLSTKVSRFVLENLAPDPVTVILGRQEINSTPFFTVVDPAGSSGFLTLDPRTPKELEIHFSGPSPSVAGSYQGVIFLASTGAQLTITPYAFVNLKIGGEASVTPQFIVDNAIASYAAFPGWAGDDASRPARTISIRNPGTAPMELGAEIGPDVWLIPEAGWNATPIPAGGVRTVNLYTQRNRAPAGSALPRYTYFTIRTRDGKTARLLVQDNDAASIGNGRAAALDAGASSIVVPEVMSEVATTGLPLATQVRMTNLGTDAVQADLYFTPTGVDGFSTSVKRATVVVPPNDVVTLTDPLTQLFNLTRPARGQLEIRAAQDKIGSLQIQAGIVSTRGDRLLIARSLVVARGTGVRSGDPHRLAGVTKGATSTTALVLAETTGIDQATVSVRLYDAAGVIKGTKSYTVKRYGHVREADVVAALGGGATLAAGQLEITTTAGAGVVTAVAEVLDASGESRAMTRSHSAAGGSVAQLRIGKDGRAILATTTQAFVVPVVVSGPVDPLSGSSSAVGMTFSAVSLAANGVATFTALTGQKYSQNVNLAPNQTLSFTDVLSQLFGITGTARGSISATFDAPVQVSSSVATAGTVSGNAVVDADDLASASNSSTPLFVDGLEQSITAGVGLRWNVYVTNSSATGGSVTVRLYESGNRIFPIEQRTFSVAANSQLALESVFTAMGLTSQLRSKDRTDVLCNITPDGGGATITAVAVGIDNATGEIAVRPLQPGTGLTSSFATVGVTGTFPQIESFAPLSGPVGTQVIITGSGFSDTLRVHFNLTQALAFTTSGDTQITTTVPPGATDGPITVTTLGGATSSTAFFTVIAGQSLPAISGFTPTGGPVGTNVTITGTGLTGTSTVTFNGVTANYTPVSDTQVTATVPAGATTGKIAVTTAGGTGESVADFTVIVPPSITNFTPTSGVIGASVTINGTALAGATNVTFNGISANYTPGTNTQLVATVPVGATTGKLAVTTPGGTATSSADFTVILPPIITGFTPASGIAGTGVTISGTGFTGIAGVTFNGVAANYTLVSDTQITTTVPVGATTGKIAVTTPGGTASSAADFTVATAPSITGFTPTSGPLGTPVDITGSGFAGGTSVKFGGVEATFTIVSGTSITTSVPAGATSGSISVTTPAGTATSTGTFTVTRAPSITSFNPTSGPPATSVTISGSGFNGATSVVFGDTAATFNEVSDTTITTIVPVGAPTGRIIVTTPSGSATSDTNFFVTGAPVITTFSPVNGLEGTLVTIHGSGFVGTTQVTFNNTPAAFSVADDTQITATVPAGATTGKIEVTTATGKAISARNFIVGPLPQGDTNGDGVVDAGDVVFLINYLFAGNQAPLGSADVNADGVVDIADVFYLINYVFMGGPAPV